MRRWLGLSLLMFAMMNHAGVSSAASPEAVEAVTDRLQVTDKAFQYDLAFMFDLYAPSATFLLGQRRYGFIFTLADRQQIPTLIVIVHEKIMGQAVSAILADVGLKGRPSLTVQSSAIQLSMLSIASRLSFRRTQNEWDAIYDEAIDAFLRW